MDSIGRQVMELGRILILLRWPPRPPRKSFLLSLLRINLFNLTFVSYTPRESEPTPHKETTCRGVIFRESLLRRWSIYIPTFCINLSIREIVGICRGRVQPKSLRTSDTTMHQNSNLPNRAVYRESILGSQSGCDALRAELPPTSIQFCLDHFQGSPHCR